MQTVSNTLFLSTKESDRIVRTPFEFDKVQKKVCNMLSAEMKELRTEEYIESEKPVSKLSPLAAFAVFIASFAGKS